MFIALSSSVISCSPPCRARRSLVHRLAELDMIRSSSVDQLSRVFLASSRLLVPSARFFHASFILLENVPAPHTCASALTRRVSCHTLSASSKPCISSSGDAAFRRRISSSGDADMLIFSKWGGVLLCLILFL